MGPRGEQKEASFAVTLYYRKDTQLPRRTWVLRIESTPLAFSWADPRDTGRSPSARDRPRAPITGDQSVTTVPDLSHTFQQPFHTTGRRQQDQVA